MKLINENFYPNPVQMLSIEVHLCRKVNDAMVVIMAAAPCLDKDSHANG